MSASPSAVPQSPDLLTADQVAGKLSVSKRTVYRMVAVGELPAPVKRNRKWARWPVTDVHAYLDKLLSQRRGQ